MNIDASQQKIDAQVQEIRAAGQHYASVSGIVQAAYFAAISMSDVKKTLDLDLAWPLYLPMVFWIASLGFSFGLMEPRPLENTWEDLDKQRDAWLASRRRLWNAARYCFFAGLLGMVIALIYYLFFVDLTAQSAALSTATPAPTP